MYAQTLTHTQTWHCLDNWSSNILAYHEYSGLDQMFQNK